ncbi:MAG: hypothetical protein V1787_03615 [Candidatus Micrarchaeota archaeon]
MKSSENPESVEMLLRQSAPLAVHHVGYAQEERPNPLGHLSRIMKFGLVSPVGAEKIEKRLKKRIFLLTEETRRQAAERPELFSEVHGGAFHFSHAWNPNAAAEMLGRLHSYREMPAVVFRKPGFEGKSRLRVQPRFIIAAVLPELSSKETERWIAELKKYKKPVYSHKGKRLWSPQEKG